MTAVVAAPSQGGNAAGVAGWWPGHRDGLLRVSLRRDPAGSTCIRHLRQRFPLRTTVPFYLDPHAPGMAFIYVQNPTGGVFQGDRLVTEVEVEPGAQLHFTTQSATKVFAMDGDDDALQEFRFRLHEGAYVENIPDMLIPHATARLRQHVTVDLARDACFIGSEIIAPGRTARGELFDYHSLHLHTTIRTGDRDLCIDALRLEPSVTAPTRPGLFGSGLYLVSLLVAVPGRDLTDLVERLDQVAATAGEPHGSGGAGILPHAAGVAVRVLTPDARTAQAAALSCWREARRLILNRPLPRIRK